RRNGSSASGTPGLTTIISDFSNSPGGCDPATTSAPFARRLSTPFNSLSGFTSLTTARAPRERRNSAAAAPLRANPTTRMFLPATSINNFVSAPRAAASVATGIGRSWEPSSLPLTALTQSPQLQRRETQQREQNRDDQKSENDLRLLPPQHFKVMVERRHLEDAFAAQFEGPHLDHH